MHLTNLQAINELTRDDNVFRKELLETCIMLFNAFPSELELALKSGDGTQVQFAVHRIKANVLMVGADQVFALLQETQDRYNNSAFSPEETKTVMTTIQSMFSQLVEELTVSLS